MKRRGHKEESDYSTCTSSDEDYEVDHEAPRRKAARRVPAKPTDGPHDGARRPTLYWDTFNKWWRVQLDRLGKRPNKQLIAHWYNENAAAVWPSDTPSFTETRLHAKCLRSTEAVRDYFRRYRSAKQQRKVDHDDAPAGQRVRRESKTNNSHGGHGSGCDADGSECHMDPVALIAAHNARIAEAQRQAADAAAEQTVHLQMHVATPAAAGILPGPATAYPGPRIPQQAAVDQKRCSAAAGSGHEPYFSGGWAPTLDNAVPVSVGRRPGDTDDMPSSKVKLEACSTSPKFVGNPGSSRFGTGVVVDAGRRPSERSSVTGGSLVPGGPDRSASGSATDPEQEPEQEHDSVSTNGERWMPHNARHDVRQSLGPVAGVKFEPLAAWHLQQMQQQAHVPAWAGMKDAQEAVGANGRSASGTGIWLPNNIPWLGAGPSGGWRQPQRQPQHGGDFAAALARPAPGGTALTVKSDATLPVPLVERGMRQFSGYLVDDEEAMIMWNCMGGM